MKVEWVTVGPFQENSYLVIDEATGKSVLVDPGDEGERIVRMVKRAGVELQAVWLSHAHLDHIGAVNAVRREWQVPVLLHPADLVIYRRGAQAAAAYGLPFEQPADPDDILTHDQILELGHSRFQVHHTPGHAPGHVVFLSDGVLLGGDLLFAGSIGRVDLPLSNASAMEGSLAHVAAFDPETVVYPGHGPATTIGAELATNPFLAGVRTSI